MILFTELIDSDPLNAEHWRKRLRDALAAIDEDRRRGEQRPDPP